MIPAIRKHANLVLVASALWAFGTTAVAEPVPAPLKVLSVEPHPVYDTLFAPQSRGFLGADAVASVELSKERVLFLFGDTVVGEMKDGQRHGPMPRNTIGILTRGDGPPTVEYHWGTRDGGAVAFFQETPDDKPCWHWPGTGFMREGRLYLLMMRLTSVSGRSDAFGFATTGTTLFRIANPLDRPDKWRMDKTQLGVNDPHFAVNAACLVEGDHLMLLGHDDGPQGIWRRRVAILSRLPLAALDGPEPGARIEYYGADGKWSLSREKPMPLFSPGVTETSLHFDPVRKRYITALVKPFTRELCIVSAEKLTGPWTEPQKVYDIPQAMVGANHAYAGRAHPMLAEGPDELVLSYVVNTQDFLSMYRDPTIYYPRFLRVKLAPAGGEARK